MIKKNYRLVLIIAFFVLPMTEIRAQVATAPYIGMETKVPHLAGHRFITNPIVNDPFIQTCFRNSLGIGQALKMNLPILVIDDQVVWGIRGDLMFIGLDFGYRFAFKEWMAAFINFDIYGRLGSGVQSLLAQGISAASNMTLGWMFRLHQSDKNILSATANLWSSSGTIVNLYEYISGIIDEGGLTPENQLVRTRPFLRGGGGLRYAWAASDLIGVTVLGELAYGESVDRRESNKLYYNIDAAADMDFQKTRLNIPVGLALGIGMDSFPSGGDNTISGGTIKSFARIAYTGRDDFLLSLDMIWTRLHLKYFEESIDGAFMTVNMKYFF